MEIIEIQKPMAINEYKHDEYYIIFKDPMRDSIKLTLLSDYALISGGFEILIRLGKNINPYMRLAELVAKDPDNDYYAYFKSKIVENYRNEEYDSDETKNNIQEYIKRCYQESIIEEYKIYKDLNKEEWDNFLTKELNFDYKNQFFILTEVFEYTKEKFIDKLNQNELSTLISFKESNFDRYRVIFNLLQHFFVKTISKEAIMEYYAEIEKQEA